MTVDCYFRKNSEGHDRCTHRGPYKGHVCDVLRQAGRCPGLVTKDEAEYQIEASNERDIDSRNEREAQCPCRQCRGVE